MIGKIEIYNKVSYETKVWEDPNVNLKTVSRSVIGEKMQVMYSFVSNSYDRIRKLTNFAYGKRDRIAKFYLNDDLMHVFDTENGGIIVQEYINDDEFRVEISFFLEVDDI